MRYLSIIPIALLCVFLLFAYLSSVLNTKSTGLTNEEIEQIRASKPKPSTVEYVEPKWEEDVYHLQPIDDSFPCNSFYCLYSESVKPSNIKFSPQVDNLLQAESLK